MRKGRTGKLKRTLCVFLSCLLVCLLSSGCTHGQKSFTYGEKRKVIIDTDTAGDDAMALMLMAKAPNMEILGVTVLAGNVSLEQGCKNALMSLETAGRKDIRVYPGSDTEFSGKKIEPFSVFGEDGMGDIGLIHPEGTPEETDGVDFILESVRNHPGEIEILATGPLTNVAKAIRKDPETMAKVKRIWSMGTGGMTYLGNATPVAEFNVYMDVEAYAYVLKSGIPVTIAGNDICDMEGVRVSEMEQKILSETGECGKLLSEALAILLQEASDEEGYAQVCDPVAAAAMIWSDFVTDSASCDASVVTHACESEGQVIFYRKDAYYDMAQEDRNYHIDVITDVDGRNYLANVYRLLK